jgi:hypothetical protein
MNFTKFFLTLMLATGLSAVYAQTYDQLNVQLQFLNQYGKIYQRGGKPLSYIGSPFFNDEWSPMYIKFRDSLIRFDAVKLNLLNANVEVQLQGEEKVIAGYFFEYVLVPGGNQKRFFIPANLFSHQGKQLQGFVEVLGTDDSKVFVQHYIHIREPHAQAHITGGFTTDRLMKTTDLFIYESGQLTLVKSKKDLQAYYRKKSTILTHYIKDQNPNIKDPAQLFQLVTHMKG